MTLSIGALGLRPTESGVWHQAQAQAYAYAYACACLRARCRQNLAKVE